MRLVMMRAMGGVRLAGQEGYGTGLDEADT